MSAKSLLEELNEKQREAVTQTEGPVLVLAGAGSGKTRVLTYRIAHIINQGLAQPHEILAVTFTNKAASEMKQRIEWLLQMSVRSLWIGTFHSISTRILHSEARLAGYQSNFTIYDVDDQINQIRRIMEFLNINKESISPRQVQYHISNAKNKIKDARMFEKEATDYKSKLIAKIFWEYEVALRRNNAMDFDDLLVLPIDIFTRHPEVLAKYQNKFKYILVDEYQDTNRAQYYWIKLLSQKHRNLCVVGDEDQSIYKWRGADISNILNFEKDFPEAKVVRLEQNYRSTQTILKAANAVVANNENRLGKKLWSDIAGGGKIQVYAARDEVHEASLVVKKVREELSTNGKYNLGDMVVLYRTNAQSRALEEQFRRNNIPYTIVGGIKFYERKEIKDILAYLRVIVNPNDSVNLQRIINFPTRGIGATSLRYLMQYAYEKETTLYNACLNHTQINSLTGAVHARLDEFLALISEYRTLAEQLDAYRLTSRLVEQVGLKRIYEKSDLVEDETRVENINELLNSIEIYVENNPDSNSLTQYLDEISLITDIDRWDANNPTITMMTLHSVKGLEFPVVFICGMEDGLFPLSRTFDNPEDLEEERRLFYVGMTRAKEKLYLMYAQSRHRFSADSFGSTFRSVASRFIREIPEEYVENHSQVSSGSSYRQTYQSRGTKIRKTSFFNESSGNLPDENSEYKIGQYVVHETFGKGQILGVDVSNLGTKLTIQFSDRKIRKLIAEYANLTPVNK
ncbi:MAG: DNA helicase PcrA [Calditrichia bacterium]